MKLVGENLFKIGQNVEYVDNSRIKGEIIDLRVKKRGLTVKYIQYKVRVNTLTAPKIYGLPQKFEWWFYESQLQIPVKKIIKLTWWQKLFLWIKGKERGIKILNKAK